MRRGTTLVGGLVAIVTAFALAGCTGASAAAPRTAPAAPPTPTSAAVPARIPNDPSLRADATMTSCVAAAGGWSASGRITNPSGKARDYLLTVLFTSDRATVIGTGSTSVHVGAGAKAAWKVRSRFTPAPTTLCVLSGVA